MGINPSTLTDVFLIIFISILIILTIILLFCLIKLVLNKNKDIKLDIANKYLKEQNENKNICSNCFSIKEEGVDSDKRI